jgi:hypothetical protein
MNPVFEIVDEKAPVVVCPEFPPIPEEADEARAGELLAVYEETVKGLPAIGQHTLAAYADAVDQIKLAAKNMEAIRKKKVDPLNADLKRINGAYIPFVDKFTAMAKRLSEIPNRWLDEQQRLRDEEQRRINAETERKRIEAEQVAEKAREAERAALEKGDEKEATKQGAKAEQQELRAAEIAPEVVQQVSKSVDLGGSKVGFAGRKMVWALTGWDKDKPLDLNSPLLASLIGDVSKLPLGIQFLLKVSQINPTKLNKLYGIEPFPKPFSEVPDYSGSRRTT